MPAATAARLSRGMNCGSPPRLRALAGDLDRVGGVEDDRGVFAHDGQRAHVDHEVVVAEAGAALGEGDAIVAAFAQFGDGVAHVLRGDELAFLYVDGAAGAGGGDEQVGLAAEEGGDLQDVDDLAGGGGLGGLVDIGEDGKLDCRGPWRRMRKPSARPGPRKLAIEVRLALS